jgi:ABC-type glycerol-3-phosphate transport system substrate-binding protein
MLKSYGFDVPKTWPEMLRIFEVIKKDGIFGISTNTLSMQDLIFEYASQKIGTEKGVQTLRDIANGKVSFNDPSVRESYKLWLECAKDAYNKGYWYPGSNGLPVGIAPAESIFLQGKSLMLFNHAGAYKELADSCDFEVGIIEKPVLQASFKPYTNLEINTMFIPVNAKNKKESVAFLKFFTSPEAQQILADNWEIYTGTEVKNIPSQLQEQLDIIKRGNVIPNINPVRIGTNVQYYLKTQIITGSASSQMTTEEAMDKLEDFRIMDNGGIYK